jgi:hypothetical protein
VQSFFAATTKHGTLTFTNPDDAKESQKIEYWFEGDRYRLSWFNADGTIRIHMISPDGITLYNCYVIDEVAKKSYVGPEFHQWIFNGPPGWTPGKGTTEGDLTVYKYSAKKLWDIAGSGQQFYLEDLVIYADKARIVKTVARTAAEKPTSDAGLTTSTYTFEEPELGVSIPADTFVLPYKVVAAD